MLRLRGPAVARAAILVAAGLCLTGSGCLLTEETVEPLSTVKVSRREGCQLPAGARQPPRLYRFVTRHPYSAGPGDRRSYVKRTVPTRVQEGPRAGWPLVWRLVQLGAYLVTALCLALGLSILLGYWIPRRLGRIKGALLAAVGLLIGLAVSAAAGHTAGSEFVIDNGLDQDVEISINGRHAGTLRARHFFTRRIGGGEVALTVTVGGRVVESARLKPDPHLGLALVRALFGRGWYLYSICGHNRYRLGR